MDKITAKKIGSTQAIKAVLIGLIIAYAIMVGLDYEWERGLYSFLWFRDISFKFQLLLSTIAVFIIAHFFGKKAGVDIILKNKNAVWIGTKYGFGVVWTTTILSSLFQTIENIRDNNVLFDYMFKPIYWVTLWGFIPIFIVGFWFGKSIKRKIKN